jgi:MFS transporter, DHA1 family, inner membrane transport protein
MTTEMRAPPDEMPAHVESNTIAVLMYGLLLAAYSLMAADRYLFPVLAPDVRRQFGFSLATTGLLSTIFTLGLGLGGLPTGYLLSRVSRRFVAMAGIAIFSAGIAATTLATGFWSLFVCLAVTGIGMAMYATVMFALAASYFVKYRGAAVGSVNLCYGVGGIYGPILASALLAGYSTWRAPMVIFGATGVVFIVAIAAVVRPWFSETRRAQVSKKGSEGATTLANRNTILLTLLSVVQGFVLYGYLGMYPTFLREGLGYDPKTAGFVMSFFGLGAIFSIAGGWLGDKWSPRIVLGGAFAFTAVLGYLLFHGSDAVTVKAALSFAYGVVGSAVLYVNLAAFHVKAVTSAIASRASGLFVTSLYASSAPAGYLLGWLASQVGWPAAGGIQMSLLSLIGVAFALALSPKRMSL